MYWESRESADWSKPASQPQIVLQMGWVWGDEGQSRGGKVGTCGLQHRNLGWCAEFIPKFYLTSTVDPVMPTALRARFCLLQPLALLLLSLTQEQAPAAPGTDELFLKLPEPRDA